jgi:hypothetical protein
MRTHRHINRAASRQHHASDLFRLLRRCQDATFDHSNSLSHSLRSVQAHKPSHPPDSTTAHCRLACCLPNPEARENRPASSKPPLPE